MRILSFNHGCGGDLILGTIAARAAKEQLGNPHITYNINKRYEWVKPLLENHDDIDAFFISGQYEPWPSEEDQKRIDELKFDRVYNAMSQHTSNMWYTKKHQTVEACHMHGLKEPSSLQIKLNKYFKTDRNLNCVAICPLGATRGEAKSLSDDKVLEISRALSKMGKIPVHVCAPFEKRISGVNSFSSTFFNAVKFCLGCDSVITVDTAMSWAMSGYQHNVVGLYGVSYYDGATSSNNWQPINPNAIYLESMKANDIEIDEIIEAVGSF